MRHPADRHGGDLGRRAGRPVRDPQRRAARRAAGDRDRPRARAAGHGAGRRRDHRSTSRRRACSSGSTSSPHGKGPEKCIDAVGLEAHATRSLDSVYDRAKQAVMLETDRAARAARDDLRLPARPASLSIPGVYGGLVDKIPFGALMNKGLTVRTGQTHVNRWTDDLLRRIEDGQIDPSFVITHTRAAGGRARDVQDLPRQGGRLHQGRAQALRTDAMDYPLTTRSIPRHAPGAPHRRVAAHRRPCPGPGARLGQHRPGRGGTAGAARDGAGDRPRGPARR